MTNEEKGVAGWAMTELMAAGHGAKATSFHGFREAGLRGQAGLQKCLDGLLTDTP